MNGREHLELLPPDVRARFMDNLIRHRGNNLEQALDYLDSQGYSFRLFIACAFYWSGTPEGLDYWDDIWFSQKKKRLIYHHRER